MPILTRTKKFAAAAAAALLVLQLAGIAIDGLRDEIEPADAILVLGNEVYRDGSLSPRLKARVDRAIELYRAQYAPRIVVSGGIGKSGQPEGDAMAAYLRDQGIPASAVLIDNQGVDTRASAVNFARFAAVHGFDDVIAVSQFFHLSRCRLALAQEGIETVCSARARYFEWRDLYSILREIPAFYAYLLHIK